MDIGYILDIGYLRYIDDIFMLWTHGKKALNIFCSQFNLTDPNIQLKAQVKYVHIFYLLIHSLSSVKFVTDLTKENYKNMKVEIMSQLFCGPSKMLREPSIVRVPLDNGR